MRVKRTSWEAALAAIVLAHLGTNPARSGSAGCRMDVADNVELTLEGPASVGSASVAEHRNQLPRRILLAAVMVGGSAVLSCARDKSAGGQHTAIQGIWTTILMAPDHPEWGIEDHLCPLTCPPIARQHIRSLLANPANDTRSLGELARETAQVRDQHLAQLRTDAARETLRRRGDLAADPAIQCDPPNLVNLLLAPTTIAIEVHDDTVIIHNEYWNTVRTIRRVTGQSALPGDGAATRLGSSTARVEGATLIVESRNVAGSAFSPGGGDITTTDGTRIVERYAASGNGARLDLELIIDDPASYRQPLVLALSRVRTPDAILDMPPCEAISGKR